MKRSFVGVETVAGVLEIASELIRRARIRPRRRIRVSRVSDDWLRAHAKESSKRRAGP